MEEIIDRQTNGDEHCADPQEVQHTSGPWVIFTDQRIPAFIMPAGRPGTICTFDCDREDEIHANARLIAAAPDLLEALKWAVAEAEGRTYYAREDARDACLDRARAAIAKAAGQS